MPLRPIYRQLAALEAKVNPEGPKGVLSHSFMLEFCRDMLEWDAESGMLGDDGSRRLIAPTCQRLGLLDKGAVKIGERYRLRMLALASGSAK